MLTNSPHIFNKKNRKRIRLTAKDRAWYAVATLKDGGDQMELDVVQQGASPKKPPVAAKAKSRPEKPEAKPKARSASQKPGTPKPNKATKAQRAEEQRALESVKSLEYIPFKFLLRSLRTPVCVPSSVLKGVDSSSSSSPENGTGSAPPTRPCEDESDMTAWSRRQVRKTTATKTKVKPAASDEETHPEGADPAAMPVEAENAEPEAPTPPLGCGFHPCSRVADAAPRPLEAEIPGSIGNVGFRARMCSGVGHLTLHEIRAEEGFGPSTLILGFHSDRWGHRPRSLRLRCCQRLCRPGGLLGWGWERCIHLHPSCPAFCDPLGSSPSASEVGEFSASESTASRRGTFCPICSPMGCARLSALPPGSRSDESPGILLRSHY